MKMRAQRALYKACGKTGFRPASQIGKDLLLQMIGKNDPDLELKKLKEKESQGLIYGYVVTTRLHKDSHQSWPKLRK